MANIDLTNYYRRRNEKISSVDSSIQLNKSETDDEIYSDLLLDLAFSNIKERQLNAKENNKDLVKLINERAVINAVKNILATTKNTRLLNPDIEFDLRSYLFDGLNATSAWFIGYEIHSRISQYEPRIEIDNINVMIDWDNDCYIIELEITIPSLSKNVKLSSILDKNGLSF